MYKRQTVLSWEQADSFPGSLQELEASIDRLISSTSRFSYEFAMQIDTDGVRDRELQELQVARYQNCTVALVYALQFKTAKSVSG